VGALLDLAALLRVDHFLCHPVELFQNDGLATIPAMKDMINGRFGLS